MLGLITFTELRRYYRVNRADWVFFTAAMAGILFFGIIQGIAIGVALSLLLLIARTSQTSLRRLERDPTSGSYFDVSSHDGLQQVPGVLVVRMDGPLFFADASRFRQSLNELLRQADGPIKTVVLDADSVN
jgi:sulfate permease, SulP family